MTIDADVKQILVEIEGETYSVAPRTALVADKLAAAVKRSKGKKPRKLWIKRLNILLGGEAVSRLFPGGKNENLDRMEIIYLGVMDAFDANARQAREKRDSQVALTVERMAKSIEPLSEIIKALGGRDALRRSEEK